VARWGDRSHQGCTRKGKERNGRNPHCCSAEVNHVPHTAPKNALASLCTQSQRPEAARAAEPSRRFNAEPLYTQRIEIKRCPDGEST